MRKLTFAVVIACVSFIVLAFSPSVAAESAPQKPVPWRESVKPLPILEKGNADEAVAPFEAKTQTPQAAKLVSTFSTVFDLGAGGRSYNIALAAGNFCWLKVGEGEKMSFNAVVGPRTEQRGYRSAKVIENGEYVVGTGGGVCQVSTTLYNAWIGAGLSAESVRAHSLPSSYCELSRDATVSDYIDLVLVNDGEGPVYIDAEADAGRLTFRIYGTPRRERYEFLSEIEETFAPVGETIEFVPSLGGEDFRIERAARNGYRSRLVRLTYEGELLKERKVLRRDIYPAVPAKVLVAEDID